MAGPAKRRPAFSQNDIVDFQRRFILGIREDAVKALSQHFSRKTLETPATSDGKPFLRLDRIAVVHRQTALEFRYGWRVPAHADVSGANVDLIANSHRDWLQTLCACNSWLMDEGNGEIQQFASEAYVRAKHLESELKANASTKMSKIASGGRDESIQSRDAMIREAVSRGENRKALAARLGVSAATISRATKKV